MNTNPWQSLVDPSTGYLYYWNRVTNETRWPGTPPGGTGRTSATQWPPIGNSPPAERPRTTQSSRDHIERRPSQVSAASNETPEYAWTRQPSQLEAGFRNLNLGGPLPNRSSHEYPPDSSRLNLPTNEQAVKQKHATGSTAWSNYNQYNRSCALPPALPRGSSSERAAPHQPLEPTDNPGVDPSRRVERYIDGSTSGALTDPLDADYKVRSTKWYKEGKVFLMLWSEPTASQQVGSDVTLGIHGQNVHSRIRRFVVIRVGNGSSACLQILTYTGQGVRKHGVTKSDHAIIYTGDIAPRPNENEMPSYLGEVGMRPVPIKVTPHNKGEKLDTMSRVNLGKIYTVEHNLRVRGFGLVDNVDMLQTLHRQVWYKEPLQQISIAQQLSGAGRGPATRRNSSLSSASYGTSQRASTVGQSYGSSLHYTRGTVGSYTGQSMPGSMAHRPSNDLHATSDEEYDPENDDQDSHEDEDEDDTRTPY